MAEIKKIKTGTVLYTRDKLVGEVHSGYITALADNYVTYKDLVMTDEEIESYSLTNPGSRGDLLRIQ